MPNNRLGGNLPCTLGRTAEPPKAKLPWQAVNSFPVPIPASIAQLSTELINEPVIVSLITRFIILILLSLKATASTSIFASLDAYFPWLILILDVLFSFITSGMRPVLSCGLSL